MTKNIKIAIAFSFITAIGIIIAQSYWITRTYRYNRLNFERAANSALQFAVINSAFSDNMFSNFPEIDKAEKNMTILGDITSTFYSSLPPNSEVITIADTGFRKDLKNSNQVIYKNIAFEFIDSTDTCNLILPKGAEPKKINIRGAIFQNIMRASLHQNKIDIPFTVYLQPEFKVSQKSNEIFIPVSSKQKLQDFIVLKFPTLNSYLFKNMLAEFLLTVGMIIIAIICLYYLLRIIYKQKQLAELKNDFISNVTHELKTPVSILMATNEALIKYSHDEDKTKLKRYLSFNQDELNKLHAMLDKIVTISTYENNGLNVKMEPVNISDIIQTVLNRFSGLEQVNLHFKNTMLHENFTTNKDSIEMIVTNLVDNAIKYSDKFPREVWVKCQSTDAGILISVKDNGIGIEKKYRANIFDKFFRVPKGNQHDVKGYGLGLSYVKQLVENLNGNIETISEPGSGSSFIVNLPLNE